MSEPLSAMPARERPRERLARLGAAALKDSEVLALMLGTGVAGRNVVVLAESILMEAGGFRGLVSMSAEQLQRLSGIGPAGVGRLTAAAEMWRRAAEPVSMVTLTDSAVVARVVLPKLMHRRTERLLVLVGTRALRLMEVAVLREGSEVRAEADPSEVLQVVLARGGGSFAVAHNHPGGSLDASQADLDFTAKLRTAAVTVGVRFLDHVVVAGNDWRSIA